MTAEYVPVPRRPFRPRPEGHCPVPPDMEGRTTVTTWLTPKPRRARKRHHCSMCWRVIYTGEIYHWSWKRLMPIPGAVTP